MRTRSIIVERAGELRLAQGRTATPRADEATVRIRYGGICGSDLHYWQHGRVGTSVLRHPLTLGHEVVGTVEVPARDGSGPVEGAPVFVHPAVVCGQCPACRRGRANLCDDLRYLGSAARDPHTDGGFSERLVAPSSRLLSVDGIPLRVAALVEPASVAWHAVDRAARIADLRGDLAVVGAGPIGLLCIAVLASRYPTARITAIDLHPHALELALAVGAHHVALVGDAARTVPEGAFSTVFESSGSQAGFASALGIARAGGAVVAVGQLPKDMAAPLQLVVGRELDVIGSSRFHDEARAVIDALRAGLLTLNPIVTHTFPLDDFAAAFALAADASRSSKVLLDFGLPARADGEARS